MICVSFVIFVFFVPFVINIPAWISQFRAADSWNVEPPGSRAPPPRVDPQLRSHSRGPAPLPAAGC